MTDHTRRERRKRNRTAREAEWSLRDPDQGKEYR